MCLLPPDNYKTGKSCIDCKYFETEMEKKQEDSTVLISESISDFPNCVAFPEGIPGFVYNGGHCEKIPGQVGDYVFTPADRPPIWELMEAHALYKKGEKLPKKKLDLLKKYLNLE